MDRNTLLDLIPAYALGALDDDMIADIEALLATDAEAKQLLAEYQALTEALVLATPARPAPSHLGDDLRHRLAASRAESAPAAPSPTANTDLKVIPGRRPRIWIPVAAAAAILIILAGVVLLGQPKPTDPAQLYAQIAADPNALHYAVSPVSPATTSGDLVVSADGRQAIVRVENLPPLTADQTYQLWLVDPDGAHSGGLMRFSNPEGTNYIPLPLDKPIKDYVAVGVSIEPEGGSPKPDAPSGPQAFGVTIAS